MRLAALVLSVAALLVAGQAHAQNRQRDRQQEQQRQQQDAEDNNNRPRIAPLGRSAAAGPCPYVKILYEAARYVEVDAAAPSMANVGYTGEIEGLTSTCAYQGDEPITVQMRTLFNFGRGPQAVSDGRTYRYWVALTERNKAILDKQYFDIPVTFDGRQTASETRDQTIVIPRANASVSGDNFEILVGFEVTPAMAEFNRTGSRFRVNAGTAPAADPAQPPAR
jgi:hypothetical protein